MTSLVDRYVFTAVRRVPEGQRSEIDRELRASIEDAVESKMETGATRDEAVDAALRELGDPSGLADHYAGRRNYLIGPELYPGWRVLLKLLLATVLPIVVVVTVVVQLLEDPSKAVGEGFSTLFSVGINLVFWVTLVFALIERAGLSDLPTAKLVSVRTTRSWTPDDLPKYESRAMTLGQLATELSWLAVLIAALVLQQFTFTDQPLLDPAGWHLWWPSLIAAFLLRGAFYAVVYRQAAWTRAAVAGNAVAALLWAVPTIWLLATDRFFNPAFHGLAHSDVKHWVTVSVIMIVALITVWDTVDVIRRARAARRGVPATPLGDLHAGLTA
jgi:hypothetical protein